MADGQREQLANCQTKKATSLRGKSSTKTELNPVFATVMKNKLNTLFVFQKFKKPELSM